MTETPGVPTVNPEEIDNPTNRYLFKRMAHFFGIELGEPIADALKRIDRLAASRSEGQQDRTAINEALALLETDEIEIHEQPHELLVEACYRVRDVLSAAVAQPETDNGE